MEINDLDPNFEFNKTKKSKRFAIDHDYQLDALLDENQNLVSRHKHHAKPEKKEYPEFSHYLEQMNSIMSNNSVNKIEQLKKVSKLLLLYNESIAQVQDQSDSSNEANSKPLNVTQSSKVELTKL